MKLNKLKLVLSLIVFQTLFFSCQEKEKFEEVWNSSHPRIVSLFNQINISDLENARIEFTVEFYDEDQGERVSSYEWKVEYEGMESLIGSASKDDFVIRPETGLPAVTFDWSFTELLEVLELDYKDVKDDAEFVFIGTLKRDDGLSFTYNGIHNGDPNQSMFEGFYRFETELVCSKDYSGIVREVTTSSCGSDFEGDVTWMKGEDGIYELEYDEPEIGLEGILENCYNGNGPFIGDDQLEVIDHCNHLSLSLISWGYWLEITNININEALLEINWDVVDHNRCPRISGKTSWTHLDGKHWSPDLFFEL